MRFFYKEHIYKDTFFLDKEESRHMIRVLRKKINDEVFFINGKGYIFKCIILSDSIKKCELKVIDKEKKEKHNYYLHIAIAPTKNNDRLEWFLEKSVEIGIDEITPIICKNSERKSINKVRLENIIISAIKQSLNPYKPKLNKEIKIEEFVEKEFKGEKLIAHCYKDKEKKKIKEVIKPEGNYLVLIGPEGDFSKEEILISEDNNYMPVSLGKKRLRTETAGILCVSNINFINT